MPPAFDLAWLSVESPDGAAYLAAERAKLESKGIIHALHSARNLDEAAGAYTDINTSLILRLDPLGVIKG